jgi:hypothetical protein
MAIISILKADMVSTFPSQAMLSQKKILLELQRAWLDGQLNAKALS